MVVAIVHGFALMDVLLLEMRETNADNA